MDRSSSTTHCIYYFLELFKIILERDIFLRFAIHGIAVVTFEMVVADIGNFQHHDNPFLAVTILEILERLLFILVLPDESLGQFEVVVGKIVKEVAVSARFILLYRNLGIHGVQIEYSGKLKTAAESERIVLVEATKQCIAYCDGYEVVFKG